MAKTQPNPKQNYVASVRTALSGPDESIVKKLPESYLDSTVSEVLKYLTDKGQLTEEEVSTADSVRKEMNGSYSITVNSKPANERDAVRQLFAEKEHKGVPYQSLEVEIASVQEGGLAYLLY